MHPPPTTHHPPPTTHRLLPTTHHPPPTTHHPLPTTTPVQIHIFCLTFFVAVPTDAAPLIAALKAIKNPMESLRNVYKLVLLLISEIERKWPSAERYLSLSPLSLPSTLLHLPQKFTTLPISPLPLSLFVEMNCSCVKGSCCLACWIGGES